jgi:hypothetical protein
MAGRMTRSVWLRLGPWAAEDGRLGWGGAAGRIRLARASRSRLGEGLGGTGRGEGAKNGCGMGSGLSAAAGAGLGLGSAMGAEIGRGIGKGGWAWGGASATGFSVAASATVSAWRAALTSVIGPVEIIVTGVTDMTLGGGFSHGQATSPIVSTLRCRAMDRLGAR